MAGRPSSATVADLKKQIDDLTNVIANLTSGSDKPIMVKQQSDSFREILVVSLFNGKLNLSTEGYGRGENYSFSGFGDEQLIPLVDLKKIIRKEKKRIVEGKVYIDDPEIIKTERLTSAYRKILNKEKIEELFTKSHKLFQESFDSMTDGQKEIFSQLIVDRLINSQDIDMNIVAMVSKAVGKDLVDIAKTSNSFKFNE
jgi:hypothetical protein